LELKLEEVAISLEFCLPKFEIWRLDCLGSEFDQECERRGNTVRERHPRGGAEGAPEENEFERFGESPRRLGDDDRPLPPDRPLPLRPPWLRPPLRTKFGLDVLKLDELEDEDLFEKVEAVFCASFTILAPVLPNSGSTGATNFSFAKLPDWCVLLREF
jgi:hypothetical protein